MPRCGRVPRTVDHARTHRREESLGRLRLGVGVTDTGTTQPGGDRSGGGHFASADPRGGRSSASGPANEKATSRTGSNGQNRWAGSSRRSRRSARCGIPTANSSPGTREFFPLHNASFDLPPYKGKWPEIWIASHGPRMLRATGRYADAWFPAHCSTARDYKAGLDVVRTAASDAGRDPMSIRAANSSMSSPAVAATKSTKRSTPAAMKAFALNIPAAEWKRHGARHPMGDDFGGYPGHHSAGNRRADRVVLHRRQPPTHAEVLRPQRHTRRGGRPGGRVARLRGRVRSHRQCKFHATQLAQGSRGEYAVLEDPAGSPQAIAIRVRRPAVTVRRWCRSHPLNRVPPVPTSLSRVSPYLGVRT